MTAPDFGHRLNRTALLAAVLYGVLVVVAWRDRTGPRSSPEHPERAARTLLVLVPLTVLPQSTVTTSTISATYTFLLVPFVWLLVAVMLADGIAKRRDPSPKAEGWLACTVGLGLLVTLIAGHVSTNVELLRFFDRTGGKGLWSDAIYRTTEILEKEYPSRRVIALDWGFARSIELLTSLRSRIVEGHEFLPAPSEGYRERARELLREPGAILLAHSRSAAICKRCLGVVKRAARESGVELALRSVVRDGMGDPNTLIYEIATGPIRSASAR